MIVKTARNPVQGLKLVKKLLYKNVNRKTALFLSGGSTPKLLYQDLAKEKELIPGTVALVDERYGLRFHQNSNERMIRETGFLSYIEKRKVPFYPILYNNLRHPGASAIGSQGDSIVPIKSGLQNDNVRKNLKQNVKEYDRRVRRLFSSFPKRIAILGIGEDGHVAGLPPRVQSSEFRVQSYVTYINDFPGEFRERITLTFNALSKMDLLIVLVFGSGKQNALNIMFTQGSEEEVPARFFRRPDISKKTILITDQKVYNNY